MIYVIVLCVFFVFVFFLSDEDGCGIIEGIGNLIGAVLGGVGVLMFVGILASPLLILLALFE